MRQVSDPFSPNNVYLNIVFNHDDTTGGTETPAVYDVTKTTPIIDNCSDYYASVIRFDIPLDTVPLMIMPIIPNQANPDLSPLVIGVNNGGVDTFLNIQYIANNSLTPPTQNLLLKQVITPYYYIYTYETLLNLINITLRQVCITAALGLTNEQMPHFFFDSNTQLISLIVPDLFITAGHPVIYINSVLWSYLGNFQYSYLGPNQPNGKDYVFLLSNLPTYPTENLAYALYNQTPAVPPIYYKYTQEYKSVAGWTSLRKIVITTNSIPIRNEFVPASNGSGENISFPILTDFVPALENASDTRNIAYYVPTSQYRLIDLSGNDPLYKINIKILWEDRKGNLYPITISQFQQASLKLAFVSKNIYLS